MFMSKKLDLILATVPAATAQTKETQSTQENLLTQTEEMVINKNQSIQKMERIVAEIPFYLKREIRIYLADHPKETERTLILRGLSALGFHINSKELLDKRGAHNQ